MFCGLFAVLYGGVATVDGVHPFDISRLITFYSLVSLGFSFSLS